MADDLQHTFPLSSVQQVIWLDQALHPELPLYNIGMTWQIQGTVDADLLRKAINAVANANDALRLVFAEEQGVPVQRCRPALEVALPLRDLRGQPDGEAQARAYLEQAFRQPFDLAGSVLWKMELVQTDACCYWLQCYHHLVNDGYGVINFLHAVVDTYNRWQDDPQAPAGAGPSYREFIADDGDYLQSSRYARDRQFWRDRYAQLPAPLFADRAAGNGGDPATSGQVRWTVPRAQFDRYTAFAAGRGHAITHLILAALGASCARSYDVEQVVFGVAVHNRGSARQKQTIGMFSSVSPVGIRIDADTSFTDLMNEVAAELRRGYRHQRCPIADINRDLQLGLQGRRQLFDITLSNMGFNGAGQLGGAEARLLPMDNGYEQAPLAVIIRDHHPGEEVIIDFNYSEPLFATDEVARLQQRMVLLIEAALADPARALCRLPLMDAQERLQVLSGFNATPVARPQGELIHQMFEAHASATPQACALEHGDVRLSYDQLNRRANRLAHQLRHFGVQPDDRVAICVERGIDMIVAVLAAWKAGAAYLPLDPAYPAERLAYMVEDAVPAVLLTQQALQALLPALDIPVVLLDSLDEALATWPDSNPDPADCGLRAEHLAYVIYTSGSTGKPKGALNHHAGLCNMAYTALADFAVQPHSRVLQFVSFSFDACVLEIVMALAGGARLCLAPLHALMPGEPLERTVRDYGISHIFMPTAVLAALPRSAELGALQALIVGGEALSAPVADHWGTRHPLFNIYGPTETTIFATYYRCGVPRSGDTIPIGRPLANARVHILDRRLQPVPVGVAGEIYIGGAGVGRGYLHRPQLTAERFITDIFSDQPAARLYKTGDLARWLPDGNIEFVGRNDFQVKLRGFRIEPGEIEARLAAIEGVREALVMVREDVAGERRLVAYLTAQAGAELTALALRDTLAQDLAEYMLPAAFVVLEAFPLSPNGKLDRQALPAPERSALVLRGYEAPQGAAEQAIAAIWQELLGLEAIGRHDHFFELGGHSLLAAQLAARVRQVLGREVTLRTLFQHPQLAAFAAAVGNAARIGADVIATLDRNAPLALSYAQQRLWFLDQLDHAAGAAYHMPAALRLRGRLDLAALQAALDRVVARHESLRTSFRDIDGQTVQVIAAADVGFALQQRDLSQMPGNERGYAVQRLSDAEAIQAFDLAGGPLIRGQLLRLAADEHVLLITQHHIISDGWSVGVLVRELSTLYTAFSQGQADPLAPLALHYADYAGWQRNWLEGDILQAQTSFWKQQLASAPALLELPTDRPRPAQQSYAGGAVAVLLDAELTAGLTALSHKHGATVFMTLLAAWSTLLARLSGQNDVVVGTPVANRHRTELEGLIGFFVNTLALRVQLDDDPTVAQLLARVKAHTLAAYDHQDLPFEQVVEVVQPARSMSHSPLFQVLLNLDNAPGERTLHLPQLDIDMLDPAHITSHFDLTLALAHKHGASGATLEGYLEYASDLFDTATIERMAVHFDTLLRAMLADDSLPVSHLTLTTPAQRDQLLLAFNDTARAWPKTALIHQLFEAQAAQQPQAPALLEDGAVLDYATVNRQANQLAHYLRTLGVQPDDRVALCMERSSAMLVAWLAILKAGAAYVPLDTGYPQERLAFMLDDCAPVAILCQAALAPLLPASAVPLVLTDDHATAVAIAAQAAGNIDPASIGLHAGHLAYVVYTSGSTGIPKGVMVEHSNVVQLVINEPCVQITPAACLAYCANPAFDASTWEVWGALLNGARLLVVRQEQLLDPLAFGALLTQQGATIVQLTAGLFHQYAEALAPVFARLDYLLFGGDKANLTTVAQVFRNGRPRHLVHTYGPTETIAFTTTLEISQAVLDSQVLPIGRPIANTRAYILDRHLQPAPLGVAGEMYIGGAGVARGYLQRDELTAERFIADPFSSQAGARLYKTGDLARWLPDGTIEFIGRNDFQVKLRGFRIELGEIETRLAACAGVREALVVARDDVAGDKRLVAYFTAHEGAAPEAPALRAELAQHLADFMLPAAFVVLPAFPLTPNGKVDRKALPAPDRSAVVVRDYEAPRGDTEQVMARIWQVLLKLERVGRQDHFFELGGHSLLAVQLVARLRQEFGREVSLRTLFLHPTLAAFSAASGSAGEAVGSSVTALGRNAPLPLSFAQQRLWFLDRLDRSAGAAYHMPGALHLKGVLDRTALKTALNRVVARHESLRTTFAEVDGQTVQVIGAAHVGFALAERDLDHLAGATRDAALAEIAGAEALQPFDLASGPLFRGQLLRLAEDEHVLLLTQHHIISDGWSVALLLREISTLYAAFSQGRDDPLRPLAIQYADYAGWQRSWQRSAAWQLQAAFWKEQLVGAPALLELPTDRPRPSRQSYAGASIAVTLDAGITAGLKALGHKHQTTLFMTVLAGWAAVLGRLAGQDEVVIGTPVANRQRTELEELIGFFVNTLALRVKLGGKPSVAQLLAQVKTLTMAAYEHQDLPFEQVVEAVQPARSLAYSPLFQAAINLDSGDHDGALALPGLQTRRIITQSHVSSRFDLSLMLKDNGDTISGEIEYASDLFDASTIERLVMHLQTLLGAMAADDLVKVARLPILTAEQRRQVVQSFNDTARPYPDNKLVHQLFEEQAAQDPAAIALVCDGVQISYGELNGRANQLAHHLRALGVQPDDRVAICMERSSAMVAGWLGILKAGAAYVPLEANAPAERQAAVLADCRPLALLTQASLAARLPAAAATTATATATATALQRIVVDSDTDAAAIARQPRENLAADAIGLAAHHLAYVIYTSGSTGLPKGVMVEHRNVVQLVINNSFAEIGHKDVIVHCANPAFDASTWEVWGGLLNGARVLVVPQAVLLDPQRFTELLLAEGATAAFMTIALFNQYAEAMADLLPRMQYVLFGGERTDLSRIKAVVRNGAPEHFVHCYGPTETTTFATAFDIPGIADDAHVLPIGGPLANAQVYIVDGDLQPVPLGVVGEMYIGGAGVARGYLHQQALTTERFITDPFSSREGARLYKTGDLARWLPDGTIEFVGRNDFQVKLRGFRIELGEVEARLMACPGVREALVMLREDQPGDKRLVAYLSAQPGVQLVAADLRHQLGAHLAEYMLPSAFVVLDAFPLNANGKIDRKVLPAPAAPDAAARTYQAPVSDAECELALIWQELLGLERVGRDDHFFELGGHSLLAVQLMGRVRQSCQVEISLTDLFDSPVLHRLAEVITTLQFSQFLGEDMETMKNQLGNLSESELLAILNEETSKDE
ncbi:MAG: amino acid adenylation domain-containing protein [Duganella sp.]